MPVRIYDISKKLGLENKEILAKAKELGIAAAKVPSSSLDKITAEYLEDELRKAHPELSAPAGPKPPPAPPRVEEPVLVVKAPPPPPPLPVEPPPPPPVAEAPAPEPEVPVEPAVTAAPEPEVTKPPV